MLSRQSISVCTGLVLPLYNILFAITFILRLIHYSCPCAVCAMPLRAHAAVFTHLHMQSTYAAIRAGSEEQSCDSHSCLHTRTATEKNVCTTQTEAPCCHHHPGICKVNSHTLLLFTLIIIVGPKLVSLRVSLTLP